MAQAEKSETTVRSAYDPETRSTPKPIDMI
jgi:hypothetical protein